MNIKVRAERRKINTRTKELHQSIIEFIIAKLQEFILTVFLFSKICIGIKDRTRKRNRSRDSTVSIAIQFPQHGVRAQERELVNAEMKSWILDNFVHQSLEKTCRTWK